MGESAAPIRSGPEMHWPKHSTTHQLNRKEKYHARTHASLPPSLPMANGKEGMPSRGHLVSLEYFPPCPAPETYAQFLSSYPSLAVLFLIITTQEILWTSDPRGTTDLRPSSELKREARCKAWIESPLCTLVTQSLCCCTSVGGGKRDSSPSLFCRRMASTSLQ